MMPWLQRFLTTVLPKSWAQAVEADSRQWFMKCETCGFAQSYWDLGGIRWKASGNPRTLRRCPQCKQRAWHQTYWQSAADKDGP